ncbi:MAG TPA: biotin transporter BioY [Deltaproteobacteria bacterium]|nr:biotin transporter BioY [Deltaproteobacteria bacterium]HQI81236.1 biotin transporter BioY [Deltaproteobacteria bacterium]
MTTKRLSLMALFAALTAMGAFIKLPLWPVSITLQTFFVILSGLVLGASAGSMSQAIYIIVGLIGLPVFSGGGGPSYLMKPSMGYLVGFLLAPVAVGAYVRHRALTAGNVFIASLLGSFAIYAAGVPYLAGYLRMVLDKPDAVGIAVKTGLLLFLPGDLLKCMVLAVVVPRLKLEGIRDQVPPPR